MKFIQTPVKGMQDFLPADMVLRQHVLGLIRDTYARFGFDEIETPVMEHIENLTGRQGGENEKLIFKVLKRGAELERGLKSGELADSALRYDLTVPLCRYYACHRNDLPSPFKALQIGNVFRADRPQKGRFRQFTQCDIDIIGDGSIMAEIELIAATSKALTTIFAEVGISAFTIHLNDRRVLKAMAANAGFNEDQYDEIFIILDKMDKIGLDGVKENLLEEGFLGKDVRRGGGDPAHDETLDVLPRGLDALAGRHLEVALDLGAVIRRLFLGLRLDALGFHTGVFEYAGGPGAGVGKDFFTFLLSFRQAFLIKFFG